MTNTHPTHSSPAASRRRRASTPARGAHGPVPRPRPRHHAAQQIDHTASKPERIGAQAVFFIARGIAALIAAGAIGIGAAHDGTPAAPPTTPPATMR